MILEIYHLILRIKILRRHGVFTLLRFFMHTLAPVPAPVHFPQSDSMLPRHLKCRGIGNLDVQNVQKEISNPLKL
jgi:hypothetical protein